jgi:hypothetical protein
MSITESEGPGDWITQKELAAMLGISPKTASEWAKQGRLIRFEHGIDGAGRRRYSHLLVEREFQRCLGAAIQRQDDLIRVWGDPPREIRVQRLSGPSQRSTE